MDEGRLIVERRITERVTRYWESLCRGRAIPEENDINPEQLGDDWNHCFLLQTRDIHAVEYFSFTYLGDGILAAYEAHGIDANNALLIGPQAYHLAPRFLHVAKTAKPVHDEGAFYTSDNRKILYRQCLLPLGPRPTHVEAIFGTMLFKQWVAPAPKASQETPPPASDRDIVL